MCQVPALSPGPGVMPSVTPSKFMLEEKHCQTIRRLLPWQKYSPLRDKRRVQTVYVS